MFKKKLVLYDLNFVWYLFYKLKIIFLVLFINTYFTFYELRNTLLFRLKVVD